MTPPLILGGKASLEVHMLTTISPVSCRVMYVSSLDSHREVLTSIEAPFSIAFAHVIFPDGQTWQQPLLSPRAASGSAAARHGCCTTPGSGCAPRRPDRRMVRHRDTAACRGRAMALPSAKTPYWRPRLWPSHPQTAESRVS